MNEVLDTYFLFTEISEQLQEIVKGCQAQEQTLPDAEATSQSLAAVGASSRSRCWVEVYGLVPGSSPGWWRRFSRKLAFPEKKEAGTSLGSWPS